MLKVQDERLEGVALPPATQVAAWERLHPGAAVIMLTEFQKDKQHSRAMDWARLALQGVSVVSGLGAAVVLALLGSPIVGPNGSHQAAGILVAVGSGIGILVGRAGGRWPSSAGPSTERRPGPWRTIRPRATAPAE
jgi:hypothetical protein